MSRTQQLDAERAMEALASDMKRVAQYDTYDGRLQTNASVRYFRRCTRVYLRDGDPIGTRLIFTRDKGMHSSGWWKNPDYESCLHLSLSFFDMEAGVAPTVDKLPFPTGELHVSPLGMLPQRRDLAARWVESFYGDWKRFVWAEPPYSPDGKLRDVWHYRVFTSPDYSVPLLPRGEVYSKELTEHGWLSWSDLGYTREQAPATGSGAPEAE